jgi:hypothetical protein
VEIGSTFSGRRFLRETISAEMEFYNIDLRKDGSTRPLLSKSASVSVASAANGQAGGQCTSSA